LKIIIDNFRLLLLFTTLLLVNLIPIDKIGKSGESVANEFNKIKSAIGYEAVEGKIIRYEYGEYDVQDYQSERPYPPYFSMVRTGSARYNPDEGVERNTHTFIWPGSSDNPEFTILSSLDAFFMSRNGTLVPAPGRFSIPALNPWLVLQDWTATMNEVQYGDSTYYRDYWRTVFTRDGKAGRERLVVDPKTGFPMKYERLEDNALWGYRRVEYQYSLWQYVDGIYFPGASFKVIDNEVKASRTVGSVEILQRADSNGVHIPEEQLAAYSDPGKAMVDSFPTDTMHISGSTYLLKNRFYNEAVTLANDTVFVMDATMGWKRAQKDEEWIRKLYPGDHPVAVIVSDLAWPHIAGVRYWVSKGAAIISHRASEPFLREVMDHRRTVEPDPLEKNRENVEFHFIPVDKRRELGDGALSVASIDGIGSETALMTYDRRNQFLWAGDFIQLLDRPTAYTNEVWEAVQREQFMPRQTAAQHIPLTDWAVIDSLAR